RRARHRLHHEIDEVQRQGGEKDDGHGESQALSEPRLRLYAARIDPDERAREEHVREDHQREEVLRVRLFAEEIWQRHIAVMQKHAVDDETAEEPCNEEHQPGQQETFVHIYLPSNCKMLRPAFGSVRNMTPFLST